MKTDKVLVACPKCGHAQHEPATAYSSVCKQCRQYFRIEDVLRSAAQAGKAGAAAQRDVRHVTCFQCGTELEVSPSAQSTMCKRCSSHLDLRDYIIANAVSKNFRTRGKFVVEEGGYVFNTETFVATAVIKGRFHGKLQADETLEIHRTAEIKGSFRTGKLVIPHGSTFRWAELMTLGGADVAGELIGDVKSTGTITLRSTARMFGNIQAAGLDVESGAVVVGSMEINPDFANAVEVARVSPAPPPPTPSVPASAPARSAPSAPTQLELEPAPTPPSPAPAPPPPPKPSIARSSRPRPSSMQTSPTKPRSSTPPQKRKGAASSEE